MRVAMDELQLQDLTNMLAARGISKRRAQRHRAPTCGACEAEGEAGEA